MNNSMCYANGCKKTTTDSCQRSNCHNMVCDQHCKIIYNSDFSGYHASISIMCCKCMNTTPHRHVWNSICDDTCSNMHKYECCIL